MQITVKNNFKIEASYLTPDEFSLIENHLLSVNGAITDFWIDEYGGDSNTDSVKAHVMITDINREQFGRNGVWYNNGKSIELEVIVV